MLDSQLSVSSATGGGKPIKITPEDLLFDQLIPNIEQTQELHFKNCLSAPVDITLKSSNPERLQIEPKQKRLAPFESMTVVVTAKLQKSNAKTQPQAYKEVIKIQSEYFDQKVNVKLVPAIIQSTSGDTSVGGGLTSSQRSRDHSSHSANRQTNRATNKFNASHQRSISPQNHVQSRDSQSPDFQNHHVQEQLQQNEQLVAQLRQDLEQSKAQCEVLHQQLSEVQQQLQLSSQENNNELYINQLKQLLREKEPSLEKLIDLSLKKERDSQERKDSKVLEILKVKDRQIEELQLRNTEQEENFAKMASAHQELKRQFKAMEDQDVRLQETLKQMQKKFEQAQTKLESYEKGKEYRRLIECEEQLRSKQSEVQEMHNEMCNMQAMLANKENREVFFEEAMQRLKDQIQEKENKVKEIGRQMEGEKEKRIRIEENLKAMTLQSQKENKSNEQMEKIAKLQDDKCELLTQVEELRRWRIDHEEQAKSLIESINQIKPPLSSTLGKPHQSPMQILTQRVEDVLLTYNELEGDNQGLKNQLDDKDSQCQSLLADNKQLSLQIHEFASKKTLSRPVQTEVELEDLQAIEDLKDKSDQLQDENDSLISSNRDMEKKILQLQAELDQKNREVEMFMQSRSPQILHQESSQSNQQNEQEMIIRLNARINQLKQNEDVLLQELSRYRSTSQSSDATAPQHEEYKKQIKMLQGLLIRAKQDFDQQLQQKSLEPSSSNLYESKANDRLRKEHHQAVMAVIELKEEYSSKLLLIGDKYEQARQKLLNENSKMASKLDAQMLQMQYMEKKEARLYGQLEEARQLQASESQEKDGRIKDLEELVFKKESTISELEREIRTKEKTLMERQEQISVLINTLEGENSQDELKQKLINLSAELCSVKAIESQQVRKLNDMTQQFKKLELQSSSLQKTFDQQKLSNKTLNGNLNKVQNEYSILQKRIEDLQVQNEEKDRESTELKYQLEKNEFTLQLKEENITQLKDQLKKSESSFNQEVERLRKEFFDSLTKEYQHRSQHVQLYRDEQYSGFKISLQQIHIALCDYLNSPKNNETMSHNDQTLFKEFERALSVASQTIDKLHQDLDKASFLTSMFKQDLKSTALCKILLQRQEQLQRSNQKLMQQSANKFMQIETVFKQQEHSFKRVVRQQDMRLQHQDQELKSLEDQNALLTDELRLIRDQKDELEQSLVLFEQEFESKKFVMEKRAEITVDERFKAKHEIIKCYFDSQISRILLQHNASSDKTLLEMGREILALKLLVQKLESQILCEQSECQSLELNLAHYKEQHSQLEQRLREANAKNGMLSMKIQQSGVIAKFENEKRKQDLINLEKELIKQREIIVEKQREALTLQEQLAQKHELKKDNMTDNNDIQHVEGQATIKLQRQQIQDLQDKLLEMRSNHIQEIDGLRVQFENDLAEAKRLLTKERETLEKRYLPGSAPGDIQEENQELVRRIQDLKKALDQVMLENAQSKRKFDNEKLHNETLLRELESYKQAIIELEQTMIEMSPHYQIHSSQTTLEPVLPPYPTRDRSSSKGRETVGKKQNKMKLKSSKDTIGQSMLDDSSSLVTSVITDQHNQAQTLRLGQLAQTSNKFQFNPPAIVSALVQSKINELTILKKCNELTQMELELRQALKEAKLKEIQSNNTQSSEDDQVRKRMFEMEAENEDLKMQKAQQQIEQLAQKSYQQQNTARIERVDYPQQDYTVLIESVITLSTQIAQLESGLNQRDVSQLVDDLPQKAVEEAQRQVIKALTVKAFQQQSSFDGQQYYPPAEEQDRKLWYLELLEQQVSASESVMTSLQSFIKKLQIDIQGNLQSAASIKAASMDLANNLKKTSEEVKTLKHVIGLAKHDLARVTFQVEGPQSTINQNTQQPLPTKTLNPFATGGNFDQMKLLSMGGGNSGSQTQSVFNQLMSQQDQLQNQLTITEKVKKTLEEEIVAVKIAHQQEITSLNNKLSQACEQRNNMLQTNEELHDRVLQLESRLDDLRSETIKLNDEHTQAQSALLEKEKEKQLLAQNKSATSKHLQKLQQDMQDWRKQTDDNLQIKEKQIEELQTQLQQVTKDRERLKSENQMLRRVDKDRRSGENVDLKKLQDENQELQERLNDQINERKKEIEYWVSERATMREMIEQLENEKVNIAEREGGIATLLPENSSNEVVKQIKKRSQKKLKEKDIEINNRDKLIEDLKDELHQNRQLETQLEQKLREAAQGLQETEDRIKYLSSKLKEVELERDLVLAEKNNAINANDVTAQQIQVELNSLRECFARLKVERDNLLLDMDSTNCREREWRSSVERLSAEVQKLETQIGSRERDQSTQLSILESKNQALLSDLKFLKTENDKYKERVKSFEHQQMLYEQKLHQSDLRVQDLQYNQDDMKRQVQDARVMIKRKDEEIIEMKEQLILKEGQKIRDIEALKDKVEEIKDSNQHLTQLYENQIQDLRQRLITDKKKSETQADQIVNLAQREAVIKQLKKELLTAKSTLTKVKQKNKELKSQIQYTDSKENSNSMANSASTKQSTSRKALYKFNSSRLEEESVDKSVIKLAQLLLNQSTSSGDISANNPKLLPNQYSTNILDTLSRFSHLSTRLVDLETELAKQHTLEAISREQINDLKQANLELAEQLDDLSQRLAQLQREGNNKGSSGKNLNEVLENTKTQLRQAHQELQQLRQEWLPPSEFKAIQDKLKEAQQQVKNLREEITRKKDVINQLKAQKEQTESEARDVAQDLEGLKDDNSKLQRLIKENAKQLGMVRELKQANDQLRQTEKRLRDEIVALNDKLRISKSEALRKDTMAREMRERMEIVQEEAQDVRERESEIERLKETVKKLRLEVEIKENQVRTLKMKVEHFEGECESLKKSVREEPTVDPQLEQQLSKLKSKLKKTETLLKRTLDSLRKLAKEVLITSPSRFVQSTKPLVVAPQQQHQKEQSNQQMKQYMKDSVSILGMSIDELMDDFVAPQQQQVIGGTIGKQVEQQLQQYIDKLGNPGMPLDESNHGLVEAVEQVTQLSIKLLVVQ